MTQDQPLILVTGATGLVGAEVVRRLSERGVRVRTLVRNAGTSNAAKAAELTRLANVEIVEGDLSQPATLVPALDGVDRAMLISSSDASMRDVQFNLIDAAASVGLSHVVKLSGIIPELDSPFRFARMHGEIEQHLEQSGVPFTHIRAGEFMHSYFRQVPSILKAGALRLPDGRRSDRLDRHRRHRRGRS
ncbi:MAG TPA: NmrA family NAD(P)-binding protein [Candidatus Limnocylindrales bacterium]